MLINVWEKLLCPTLIFYQGIPQGIPLSPLPVGASARLGRRRLGVGRPSHPESVNILACILDGATLLPYNRGQSVAEAVNLAEEVSRG